MSETETETVYRLLFLSRRDGSITGVTDWSSEIPDNPTGAVVQRTNRNARQGDPE